MIENKKQAEAIEAIQGKIKVVAGAGSGKTKTLTQRYQKLVSLGVSPDNILCMTFSNKAALEMKSRVYEFIDHSLKLDYICTIHSFCLKVLYKEIELVGYSRDFSIIDEKDLKEVLKKFIVQYLSSEEKIKDIDGKILQRWYEDFLEFKSKNDYISCDSQQDRDWVFWQAIQWQKQHNQLDFDDLIHLTIYILKNFKNQREEWSKRFQYVMVDEAQDCNDDDWAIIEMLSGNGNLFIVGDPDQCIYEWRGSKPKMFNRFNAHKTIILDQNYRSTKNILSIANDVISHNKERISKDLFTNNDDGLRAQFYHAPSQWLEAKWVVTKIKDLVNNSQAMYGDFAILYRSQYSAKIVNEFLFKNNLHAMNIGGIQFFEYEEIKLIISIMRVIEFNDLISFQKVLKLLIENISDSQAESIGLIYEKYRDFEDLTEYEGIDLTQISKMFLTLREQKESVFTIHDYIELVIRVFGIEGRNDAQKSHIKELLFKSREYEAYNRVEDIDSDIKDWLRDILFQTDDIYAETNDSKIKMMSIHQAKGLEFPYVFVIGLSEGTFPNYKSLKERKIAGEEEERRLMYVACTRAKEQLFLSCANGYNSTMHCNNVVSRFMMEISEDLIQRIDSDYSLSEEFDATRKLIDMYKIGFSYQIIPGDIVTHRPSGLRGEVVKVEEKKQIIHVKFFKDNKIRKMKKDILDKD